MTTASLLSRSALPLTSRLTDRLGRVIHSLRVSIAHRRNHKCVRCRAGEVGAQDPEFALEEYLRPINQAVCRPGHHRRGHRSGQGSPPSHRRARIPEAFAVDGSYRRMKQPGLCSIQNGGFIPLPRRCVFALSRVRPGVTECCEESLMVPR